MAIRKVLVGFVSVDSGRLLIGDPVYFLSKISYASVVDAYQDAESNGLVLDHAEGLRDLSTSKCDHEHGGFIFTRFGGDGAYPVYVLYDEDEMIGITIDFAADYTACEDIIDEADAEAYEGYED